MREQGADWEGKVRSWTSSIDFFSILFSTRKNGSKKMAEKENYTNVMFFFFLLFIFCGGIISFMLGRRKKRALLKSWNAENGNTKIRITEEGREEEGEGKGDGQQSKRQEAIL